MFVFSITTKMLQFTAVTYLFIVSFLTIALWGLRSKHEKQLPCFVLSKCPLLHTIFCFSV